MTEYIVEENPYPTYKVNGYSVRCDDWLIQRGEIVRCRDCACWYRGYCGRHSYEVANEYGDTYTEGLFPMDEDDFCSLGERMEVRDD